MRTLVAMMLLGVALLGLARAAEVPRPGPVDHRVRDVNYDPDQVYQITGFFGYHITIAFQRDEVVEKMAAGYADAWDVNSHGWFISVKPREFGPDTSLVVTTNRRMYTFDLRSKMPPRNGLPGRYAVDPDQIFVLRFRYPREERAAAEAARLQVEAARQVAQARAEDEARRMASMAGKPARPTNHEYFYQGADAIAPYEAWDDGTFTYFRFYAQQDLPAAFIVNADGTESIANKHFDKDVMVVQRVARQMRLRKGNSVVCVFNENREFRTPQPTSGATDDGAERINRGR